MHPSELRPWLGGRLLGPLPPPPCHRVPRHLGVPAPPPPLRCCRCRRGCGGTAGVWCPLATRTSCVIGGVGDAPLHVVRCGDGTGGPNQPPRRPDRRLRARGCVLTGPGPPRRAPRNPCTRALLRWMLFPQ